jgi:hypothetical protein
VLAQDQQAPQHRMCKGSRATQADSGSWVGRMNTVLGDLVPATSKRHSATGKSRL